jgi:hypothetical protein
MESAKSPGAGDRGFSNSAASGGTALRLVMRCSCSCRCNALRALRFPVGRAHLGTGGIERR